MNTTVAIVLIVFIGGIVFAIRRAKDKKATGTGGGRDGKGKNKV